MTRSFADAMGLNWPPEIACIVNGQRVTWAEMGEQKRQRQRDELASKRRIDPLRIVPAYVWTFRVPGWLFAGWHCWVVTRHEQFGVRWSDRGKWSQPTLAESIMRAYPMGLLPIAENFERWMIALAKTRPRRHPHDPRPAGSLIGWLDREWSGRFAMTREELEELDQ
jgi:hypothetical protein